MATEKYVNGTGIGYLWSKMKATFLLSAEEMSTPSIANIKFATLDDTNPHNCGNSVSGMQGTRKIIPLQASPDFNGSTGCYIYESYTSSSQRVYRTAYQLNSMGKLYTIPSSGSPSLVTSLPNVDGGLSNSDGFYVLQDTAYGNWWLSNDGTIITAETLGIVAPSGSGGGSGGDPPIVHTPATLYIVETAIDTEHLSDTPADFWTNTDGANVYIKPLDDDELDWSMFWFSDPVTSNGGTRSCPNVSDGFLIWNYTLTRTNLNTITITRSKSHIMPIDPE